MVKIEIVKDYDEFWEKQRQGAKNTSNLFRKDLPYPYDEAWLESRKKHNIEMEQKANESNPRYLKIINEQIETVTKIMNYFPTHRNTDRLLDNLKKLRKSCEQLKTERGKSLIIDTMRGKAKKLREALHNDIMEQLPEVLISIIERLKELDKG